MSVLFEFSRRVNKSPYSLNFRLPKRQAALPRYFKGVVEDKVPTIS